MVRSIVNSVKKVRPYVMLIAYGIVLSDVLNLAQEVAQEFVVSRFFPQKIRINREEFMRLERGIVNNDLEQTSDFENVKFDVTTVSKRNDSYKFFDGTEKSIPAEMALQADSEQALSGTVLNV